MFCANVFLPLYAALQTVNSKFNVTVNLEKCLWHWRASPYRMFGDCWLNEEVSFYAKCFTMNANVALRMTHDLPPITRWSMSRVATFSLIEFKGYFNGIMNLITLHDFIFHNRDSKEEYIIESIHFHYVSHWPQ